MPDANTTAIDIATGNVTLDLNGFVIRGVTVCEAVPVTCSPTGNGVGVQASSRTNIAVVNGIVTGMGSFGIIVVGDVIER